jgi:dolichol-phosphate mannosyltransferase
MVSWLGFKTYAYEYERDSRYAGETKFSITKMMRFALDGITSFSDKPLYLSGYLGLVISLLGMAYSVKIFFSWLFGTGQLVPGWATVVIAVFLVGGVQLICLSIIGQYIGRIYKETKRRPLYAIKDKINF